MGKFIFHHSINDMMAKVRALCRTHELFHLPPTFTHHVVMELALPVCHAGAGLGLLVLRETVKLQCTDPYTPVCFRVCGNSFGEEAHTFGRPF